MIKDEHGDIITCTKCGSDNIIRSGMVGPKQRYQCKACYSFFVAKPRAAVRAALTKQKAAILMYLAGALVKDLESVFDVSHTTISKWIAPAQEMLEKNPELKEIRRLKEFSLTASRSNKNRTLDPKKVWLTLELDDDHYGKKSLLLREE